MSKQFGQTECAGIKNETSSKSERGPSTPDHAVDVERRGAERPVHVGETSGPIGPCIDSVEARTAPKAAGARFGLI